MHADLIFVMVVFLSLPLKLFHHHYIRRLAILKLHGINITHTDMPLIKYMSHIATSSNHQLSTGLWLTYVKLSYSFVVKTAHVH